MTTPIQDVVLDIGGLYFGGGRTRVRTLLGSCISITLWHPLRRIGGMCHYMLPGASQNPSPDSPPGLYAEGAVQWFLEAISNAGTVPGDYVAKLFGGGRMFGSNTPNAEPAGYGLDICDRNIACGRELLQEKGFKVAAEDVGGAGSREVLFEIWSGDAWVCRGPELAV